KFGHNGTKPFTVSAVRERQSANPKKTWLRLDHESMPHKLRRRKRYPSQRKDKPNDSVAGLGDAGAGGLPARVGRRRVLLLLGEERRYPAAGAKSVHHLGSPGTN